eukprot:CAMPEP_0118850776 /NCGR_PEP_ID=MMETSP1163-20130328/474_1 /TAXON_ID=124430 /ORGANISM="Phaeomonas parva, Strain CCMP2877" /LENGTH=556 /DNA_ID=CAMNT_0006783009 /DNA_START=373 /DNA_END=2043 /DNA_ORIENTATION=+
MSRTRARSSRFGAAAPAPPSPNVYKPRPAGGGKKKSNGGAVRRRSAPRDISRDELGRTAGLDTEASDSSADSVRAWRTLTPDSSTTASSVGSHSSIDVSDELVMGESPGADALSGSVPIIQMSGEGLMAGADDDDDDDDGLDRARTRTSSFHEVLDLDLDEGEEADLEGSLESLEGSFDLITVKDDIDEDALPSGPPQVATPRRAGATRHRQALNSKTMQIVSDLEGAEQRPRARGGSDAKAKSADEEDGSDLEQAAARERSRRGSDRKEAQAYLRLLLLGDSGVGKTSLMLRYSEDKFASSLLSTAGVDYKVRHTDVKDKRVRLQIWDTAGQEKFHVITRSYYKGAHGICLVYSVTDLESFDNVRYWMANINQHASSNVQRVIVGNKSDLAGERQVTEEMGESLAREFGSVFLETSALDGTNVTEAFQVLAEQIIDCQENGSPIPSPNPSAKTAKKKKKGRPSIKSKMKEKMRRNSSTGSEADASARPRDLGERGSSSGGSFGSGGSGGGKKVAWTAQRRRSRIKESMSEHGRRRKGGRNDSDEDAAEKEKCVIC